MAFPSTVLLDNFNRADGAPGASWTTTSTTFGDGFAFSIVSNQLAGGGNASGAAWATTVGPNCEAYVDVPVLPAAGNGIYLDLRYDGVTATPSGYQLKVTPSTGAWLIRKVTAGASATLTTLSQAIAAGDSFGFRAVGTVLEAWYKPAAGAWTLVGTTTDATFAAAGLLGLECQDATVRYDNFSGGTIRSLVLSDRRRARNSLLRR